MNDRLEQINKLLKEELEKSKAKSQKKWFWLFLTVVLSAVACFYLLLFQEKNSPFLQGKNIFQNIKKVTADLKAAIIDPSTDQFFFHGQKNFLFLGMAGQGNDAPDLTDTIALATIKTDPLRVTLISIPRDLWVKSPTGNFYTKINTLYAVGKQSKNKDYGIELIKQ